MQDFVVCGSVSGILLWPGTSDRKEYDVLKGVGSGGEGSASLACTGSGME